MAARERAGRRHCAAWVSFALLAALASGCTESPPEGAQVEPPAAPPSIGETPTTAAPTTEPSTTEPSTPQPVTAEHLRPATAVAAVRHLAGEIGPRPATGRAFREAADWVEAEFTSYGLTVSRQAFPVPAGNSWGTPVPAGRSVNVVAVTPDFRAGRPYLLLGAHLDTVPTAPGAEDNASGVGVLLAVAQALQDRSARLPVVLVAFGAEEPRGDTDADHHYGSRAYVSAMSPRERRGLRGMLALDRVGVGDAVPVAAAFEDPANLRWRAVAEAAAERAGVPYVTGIDSASDHKSFARERLPGVRLGSTPYAGYHSPGDVPSVISRDQLARTGRVVLAWLAGP